MSVAANMKFLFSILPLRHPTYYGLTSSQGLEFVARIMTSAADVYSQTTGPDADVQKRRWLVALMDVCTFMIQGQ